MTTQPKVVSKSIRQPATIPGFALSIALLAVAAALLTYVAYQGAQRARAGAGTTSALSAAAHQDVSADSVSSYLRVHSEVPEHAARNPNVEVITDYLSIHAVAQPTVVWDPNAAALEYWSSLQPAVAEPTAVWDAQTVMELERTGGH